MKRGFTLAELLGVTVLLALIVAVSYPVMINIFEEKQGEIDSYKREIIENAAINYVKTNLNEYPYKDKQNSCVFLKTLVDNNLISYELEDELLNRIVKINMSSNNKYSAEILEAGETCKSYGLNNYMVKTCTKKDSSLRYKLVDNRTQYYIGEELIKQVDEIKAQNDSDLALFKVQANNYETLSNTLKYKNGVSIKMNKSESYFELYAEFDIKNLETFTDKEKTTLVNAPIFYDTTLETLDMSCN